MGVSKGHVKVEDLKKKTDAIVARLNLPIQVVLCGWVVLAHNEDVVSVS